MDSNQSGYPFCVHAIHPCTTCFLFVTWLVIWRPRYKHRGLCTLKECALYWPYGLGFGGTRFPAQKLDGSICCIDDKSDWFTMPILTTIFALDSMRVVALCCKQDSMESGSVAEDHGRASATFLSPTIDIDLLGPSRADTVASSSPPKN